MSIMGVGDSFVVSRYNNDFKSCCCLFSVFSFTRQLAHFGGDIHWIQSYYRFRTTIFEIAALLRVVN